MGYLAIFMVPFSAYLAFSIYMTTMPGIMPPTTTDVVVFTAWLDTNVWQFVFWLSLSVIVSQILAILAQGMIILKVASKEAGKNSGLGEIISNGFSVFPLLFTTSLVFALLIAGPIIGLLLIGLFNTSLFLTVSLLILLYLIPMFYFVLRFYIYSPICVLEGRGPIDSLRRAWSLSSGNLAVIFVMVLLITIAALLLSIIPVVGVYVTFLVVGPANSIATTLIYLALMKKDR